jgi:hypothetical protein
VVLVSSPRKNTERRPDHHLGIRMRVFTKNPTSLVSDFRIVRNECVCAEAVCGIFVVAA